MMKVTIYQVDAFAAKLFSGNPAAVCLLEKWFDDATLQAIAAENNLSETAFLLRQGSFVELRWFTPRTEVALCGHATLAAAYVLFVCKSWQQESIRFVTRQSGDLIVTRKNDLLEMDFPARSTREEKAPAGFAAALGVKPDAIFSSEEDLLVLLASEMAVRQVAPDFAALEKIPCRGVIVTAPGDHSDFVSRFFAPRVGIPEDPVTGSAHCVLIPFWSEQLRKNDLYALQVSTRGGELFCRHKGDRVQIAGRAVLYLEGTIKI
jgi:PhzF family phenazine biosynthesis protein